MPHRTAWVAPDLDQLALVREGGGGGARIDFGLYEDVADVPIDGLLTQRQLARPLSGVQHQYLTALDVPATCFTLPAG